MNVMVFQLVGWAVIMLVAMVFKFVPLGMVSYFATDAAANVTVLSKVMQKQVWRSLGHWAQMLGFIKKTQNTEVGVPGNSILPMPTGSPIEIFREFIQEGREDMLVPIKRILTGAPTGGDAQLDGAEERYKVAYKRTHINAVGKSVNVRSGPMSVQRFKAYGAELFKKGAMDLADWFARYTTSYQIQLAIFEGKSHNLTAGTEGWAQMKSLQRVSHPNFYVAGTGQICWTGTAYTSLPGTQAYEVAVAAALNGLAAGNATAFSAKLIRLMKAEAIRKKIAPTMTKQGISFYPIVIHTSQAMQLVNDAEWKADARTSLPRGWDNPVFTGALGYYDGCVLYVQDDLFGVQVDGNNAVVVDTSATTAVRYGPSITDTTENIFISHNTPLKLAVLYGPSFLSCGVGQDLRMEEELKDYKRKLNAGADQIIGLERTDIIDSDNYEGNGANAFLENTSSLVCATYSEHSFNWT